MTPPITDEALSRLEQLDKRATPAPWKAYGTWVAELTHHAVGDPDAPDTRIGELGEFDAELVAELRSAWPAMVARLRAVEAEVARLTAENDRLSEALDASDKQLNELGVL